MFKILNISNKIPLKFTYHQSYLTFSFFNATKLFSDTINNKNEVEISKMIEKLKMLRNSNDNDLLKPYILGVLNINKKGYHIDKAIIFSDRKTEHQFKSLIVKYKNIFSLNEQIEIFEYFTTNKKLHIDLFCDLMRSISKLNFEKNLNFNIISRILKLVLQNNIDIIDKEIIFNLNETVFESFYENFKKYENLFKKDKNLFFTIIYDLLMFHYLSREMQNLNFGKSTISLDILSEFLSHNIEKGELTFRQIRLLMFNFNKIFYRNQNLNHKIIIFFTKKVQHILKEQANDIVSITRIIINNNFEEDKSKNLSLINMIHTHNLVNCDFSDIKICINNFNCLTYFHSFIILNNSQAEPKIIKYFEELILKYFIFLNNFILKSIKTNYEYVISIYNSLIYLYSFSNEKKAKTLIEEGLKIPKVMELSRRHIISFFHKEVLKILVEKNIIFKVEDFEDYLSKDISIVHEEKICIEIDGPKHFYRDKANSNYSTVFKKIILTNMGWKVINISHFEWNAFIYNEKVKFIDEKLIKYLK